MKANELRTKSLESLKTELNELSRAQFNLRMQKSMGQSFRHDQFKRLRKDIARIKTVLNELSYSNTAQ